MRLKPWTLQIEEEFFKLYLWVFPRSPKPPSRGSCERSTVIVARKESPGGQEKSETGVRQD